jgi:hypothetical protein
MMVRGGDVEQNIERQPYSPPTVEVIGTLTELTRGTPGSRVSGPL